jgi:hypothetical protein
MRSIEFLREANPYQGADAAKFAAMSPEDQAWYTRGGGKPDINDPYIAMRAPNKGKPAATSSATGVGNPGEEAAAQAAADKADTVAGATDMSMGQAAAVNAADTAASATDMSMGQAAAVNAAASTPAAPTPAASPAKPAANKSMSPAIAAYASRMGLLTNNKPNVDAIKKFQTANGLTADGIIGPNTAGAILSAQKPASPAANLRGPAPAQDRNQLAKALPANMTGQAATPANQYAAPAAAPTGQAGSGSDKIRAEIDRFKSKNNMSLQANKEYVARLQAKLDAAAPTGQAAQPSATATTAAGAASKVNPMPDPNRRTGTVAQRDEWMSKYGKTHNQDGTPKSSNQAAAPAGQAATPTTSGGRPVAAPAARTFEESVDMMRRLSTMLKG